MLLGLTGQEPVIKVVENIFCLLCQRVIRRGDEAIAAGGGRDFIHPDCGVSAMMEELHRCEMKDVRHKTTTRGERQKKKVHTSDGKTFCSFCRKNIQSGDTFVREDGKPYHNTGRNSCVIRFRRVVNNTYASLR